MCDKKEIGELREQIEFIKLQQQTQALGIEECYQGMDQINSKINELHTENRLIKEKMNDITR